MLRDDPEGRSFFSLVWTNDRWPWAADETQQTREAVWVVLTETLWPLQKRLLRRSEAEPWQLHDAVGATAAQPKVLLAPNSGEWYEGSAKYEELCSALADAGLDASLQLPRQGSYAEGGVVTDPTIALSIFLWEEVAEETIGAIVALATERLRSGTKRKRQAVIYGVGGEVLRRFDLPEDGDPD
jgi:hypothetical protein